MKWLIIAVLIFAQQPTKQPASKSALPEGKTAQVGKQSVAKENDNQPAKQPPSSPTNNQQPADQLKTATSNDAKIQGNIETLTALLVIVGFLQFCALIGQVVIYCRQAKIMALQAHEMKRSRREMSLQRQEMALQRGEMALQRSTMQTAERAWVVEEIKFPDEIPRQDFGKILFVVFTIKNIGKQPAIIRTVRSRFHTSQNLPERPEYRVADSGKDSVGEYGRLIAPREKFQILSQLEELSLDDEQIRTIRKTSNLGLFAYGRIEYETSGLVGVNQFCYRWHNLIGFRWEFEKEGFRKGGPPEYNKHT